MRLSTRAQVMLQALGPARPKAPGTQFLAPLRRTVNRLLKAAHRATISPSARTAQALHEAAAAMSAAAQELGVPECAVG